MWCINCQLEHPAFCGYRIGLLCFMLFLRWQAKMSASLCGYSLGWLGEDGLGELFSESEWQRRRQDHFKSTSTNVDEWQAASSIYCFCYCLKLCFMIPLDEHNSDPDNLCIQFKLNLQHGIMWQMQIIANSIMGDWLLYDNVINRKLILNAGKCSRWHNHLTFAAVFHS